MAERTLRAVKIPVKRYGIDDSSTDEDCDEEQTTSSSSDSESVSDADSDVEEPQEGLIVHGNHPIYNLSSEWHVVEPGTDAISTALPAFQGESGLRRPIPPESIADCALQILDEEVFLQDC